jgi:peroxiredoxin
LYSQKLAACSVFVAFAVFLLVCTASALAPAGMENTDFQLFTNPPLASDFKMGTVDGGTLSLSDLRGKVVLLNFWRRDCQYCSLEKQKLNSMLQHVDPKDIAVLCVNLWDNPSWVRQYGKKNGHNLIVLSKLEGQRALVENVVGGRPLGYYILNDAKEAIYEVRGFPSTYVINKQGRVVASHLGLAEWNSPVIRNWVLSLARSGSPAAKATDKKIGDEVQVPSWVDHLLSNAAVGPHRLGGTPH